MKLKNKITIVSVISIILFCIITYLIQIVYILPTYKEIEHSEAGKDICQAVEALLKKEQDSRKNNQFLKKEFFEKKNTNYTKFSNNLSKLLNNEGIDICMLLNKDCKKIFSLPNSSFSIAQNEITLIQNTFSNYISQKVNAVQEKHRESVQSGLIESPIGIMLISYSRIFINKDNEQYLVLINFINNNFLLNLSENTRTPVKLFSLTDINKYSHLKSIIENISNRKFSIYYSPVNSDEEELETFVLIPDINGKTAFVISTLLSRLIYLEAHSMVNLALYVLIIFGVLLIFITSIIIHIIVIKPISNLTSSTLKIKNSENLSLRTEFDIRKDEIGILSSGFNDLLEQLQYHIEGMEEIIKKQTEEIRMTREDTIFRISMAIDDKNIAAGRHITRVSKMVVLLAEKMNISKKKREAYGIASTMHDIGKIGIPEEIVSKTGKYTDDEFKIMKSHTIIGGKIFSNGNSALIKSAYEIAMYHHERWDGSGYPEGLKEDSIPISARITSIVDVFDALLSKKSYKEAHSINETLDFFKENSSKMFDPEITKIFLDNINDFVEIREKYPDNI